MDNRQENRLSMGEATLEVLDKNSALVGTVPALVTAKSELVNKILGIRSANVIQLTPTKGKTTSKQQRKEALADMAYGIASSVQAFASMTGDTDLYMELNFARGTIVKMEDEQIQQVCTIILNAGLNNVASLADYGVTPLKLTTFETMIANWHLESQTPRVAIAERKTATKAIPVLLKQMDVILKSQMDKLMVLFKESEPTFYNTYLEARKVVDAGHGPKGPRLSGTVMGVDGTLLVNAQVRATYLEKTVEVMTDADGGFVMRLSGVKANTEVTVTASRPGYVTDVQPLVMQPKVNVVLNFGLVRQSVTISGKITNTMTLLGLANATITLSNGVNSVQVISNAAGDYSILLNEVEEQETGTLTVAHPLFIEAMRQVTIEPGIDRTEDFGLNPMAPNP